MFEKKVRNRPKNPVWQFSIFTENRVGRLLELFKMFKDKRVTIVAITVLDTTDSSIIRLILDDPDLARALFEEHMIAYSATTVTAVEIKAMTEVPNVLAALLEAEINIHYMYSFISRPHDYSALAISLEDEEVAQQAICRAGFRVMTQDDISR
ncbi:MAG: acetolactate synthase [Verrucomicrobiota bacterium]